MLLTRRLTRELTGGYSIVAERRFRIRFSAANGGFRVDGSQVASSVKAPPNLAEFARLEQQRVEIGLFPLELDRQGIIRSGGAKTSHDSLRRAVELALAEVKQMRLSAQDKDEARAFLLGLERAAGRIASEPPVDLFTPPPLATPATHRVALPNGLSGSITTQFSGSVRPETGLLDQAERIVLTGMDGTMRRTVEHWSMAALQDQATSVR